MNRGYRNEFKLISFHRTQWKYYIILVKKLNEYQDSVVGQIDNEIEMKK